MKLRLSIAACSIALASACSLAPLNEPYEGVDLPFEDGFESGSASAFHMELPSSGNLELSTLERFEGAYSALLRVAPGETIYNGNRAELAVYGVAYWGQTAFFRWRFMIPADDSDAYDWQIHAQWYQLPDFQRGETFDFFFAHPPVALVFEPGFLVAKGSVGTERELGRAALSKGTWHTATVEIRFLDYDMGYVQAWLDGAPITPWNGADHRVFGPTLHSKAGAYFKVGLYRGAPWQDQATGENSVYVDDVKIAGSWAEVNP
jgi:hypothetical protein